MQFVFGQEESNPVTDANSGFGSEHETAIDMLDRKAEVDAFKFDCVAWLIVNDHPFTGVILVIQIPTIKAIPDRFSRFEEVVLRLMSTPTRSSANA